MHVKLKPCCVLEFARSVRVDGERPMVIDLKLKRAGSGFSWPAILLCLSLGAMTGMKARKRL